MPNKSYLSPVVRHRIVEADWNTKKMMARYKVVSSLIREAEADSHGGRTADQGLIGLRRSRHILKELDTLRSQIQQLDATMKDVSDRFLAHVSHNQAPKPSNLYDTSPTEVDDDDDSPQFIRDIVGEYGHCNSDGSETTFKTNASHELSCRQLGVNVFQNQGVGVFQTPEGKANKASDKPDNSARGRFPSKQENDGPRPSIYGAIGQPVPSRSSAATTAITSPTESYYADNCFMTGSPVHLQSQRACAMPVANSQFTTADFAKYGLRNKPAFQQPCGPVNNFYGEPQRKFAAQDAVAPDQLFGMLSKLRHDGVGMKGEGQDAGGNNDPGHRLPHGGRPF